MVEFDRWSSMPWRGYDPSVHDRMPTFAESGEAHPSTPLPTPNCPAALALLLALLGLCG